METMNQTNNALNAIERLEPSSLEMTLDKFLVLYLQMAPLNQLESLFSSSHQFDLDFQTKFSDCILQNETVKQYPPLSSYTVRVVKRIVSKVEEQNFELHDDLLAVVMELICNCGITSNATVDKGNCFITYRTKDAELEHETHIQVSTLCNQVGLRIWEAGIFLGEYALAQPQIFENKRVLEIGAGVGLTGLLIDAHCKPKLVTMTDYDQVVLENLRFNVKQNNIQTSVDVKNLDWCDDMSVNTLIEESPYDVILAGDCVYDPESFPYLVKMIKKLFEVSSPTVIFATTLRNRETFKQFQNSLKSFNISWDVITGQVPAIPGNGNIFCYENTTMLNRNPERDAIRLYSLFPQK